MKFIDAFAEQFLSYGQKGLEQAKRNKAKRYRVWWMGMPFMTRAFNLSRYIDDEYFDDGTGEDGQDALALPDFPNKAIDALIKQSKGAEEFFRNEDGTRITKKNDGWDCAFDCGPYIEAGQWTKLLVDARIAAATKKLAGLRGKVALQVEGDDGTAIRSAKYYLDDIKEMREEREYTVAAPVIASFLALLTDDVDAALVSAAARLK